MDDGSTGGGPGAGAWGRFLNDSLAGAYRSTASGHLLECNAAFAAIFGYESVEAMKATPAVELYLDPDDRAGNLERLRTLGAIHSGELRMRRRDGTPLWVLYSERLVRDGAEEVIEGTLLDVSGRHQAEDSLRQAGHLATIGAIASGVVHELNNPLSAIGANLEFARRALVRLGRKATSEPRQEADEAVQALEDAAAAAARMKETLRQLRVLAGTTAPHAETLELLAVIDRAIELVGEPLRARARVVRNYPPSAKVRFDERLLVQALLNLLANAAQALPEGSPESHQVTVTVTSAATGLTVSITDTGPGMEPTTLARAFDPCFTTLGGAHAGMGLTTARAIIREAGGEITLESLTGRGTSVVVRLPAAAG